MRKEIVIVGALGIVVGFGQAAAAPSSLSVDRPGWDLRLPPGLQSTTPNVRISSSNPSSQVGQTIGQLLDIVATANGPVSDKVEDVLVKAGSAFTQLEPAAG